jgi:hypothetical protein
MGQAIRVNLNKGMAMGNEPFKQAIEALTGRRMRDKNGSKNESPSQPTKK